jgi:hypothetical protein
MLQILNGGRWFKFHNIWRIIPITYHLFIDAAQSKNFATDSDRYRSKSRALRRLLVMPRPKTIIVTPSVPFSLRVISIFGHGPPIRKIHAASFERWLKEMIISREEDDS